MQGPRAWYLLISALCAAYSSPDSVPGAYQLAALNGRTLPAQLPGDSCQGRLLAGGLTLGGDSTWRSTLIGRRPCDALTDTTVFAGRYTAKGAERRLTIDSVTWDGRLRGSGSAVESLAGVAHGSKLTLTYNGDFVGEAPLVFIFQRVP
jgi:hypothetical protein